LAGFPGTGSLTATFAGAVTSSVAAPLAAAVSTTVAATLSSAFALGMGLVGKDIEGRPDASSQDRKKHEGCCAAKNDGCACKSGFCNSCWHWRRHGGLRFVGRRC